MPKLSIVSWQEHNVGFTGWDSHARTELKKRLRSGIPGSPAQTRSILTQVLDRKLIVLNDVPDPAVTGIRQILETMGAVVALDN